MHFGISTFWVEGDKFDPYGTYHDCESNAKYCVSWEKMAVKPPGVTWPPLVSFLLLTTMLI